MLFTFREHDLLVVESLPINEIRTGDIVAFCLKGNLAVIGHRVRKINSTGNLITQGDNCESCDTHEIDRGSYLGKVLNVIREGKEHPVIGGRVGLIWARLHSSVLNFLKIVRPVYRALRAWVLLARFTIPFVSQIALITPEGLHIKYLFLGRSVATWQPAQGRFTCRKPFDLFIKPPG